MIRLTYSTLAAAAIAGAVVFSACGGDDGGNRGTPSSSGASAQAVNSIDEIPAGAPVIDQDNLQFKPSKLTVKAGQTVYFTNRETAIHTVNIEGKNISGDMKKGDAASWVAPSKGQYRVTCDYHPQMKATITVE